MEPPTLVAAGRIRIGEATSSRAPPTSTESSPSQQGSVTLSRSVARPMRTQPESALACAAAGLGAAESGTGSARGAGGATASAAAGGGSGGTGTAEPSAPSAIGAGGARCGA